ncbi:unannotated protein [freshwater metagenome]|uniref:Unannotated protein n=1 Tax=freshwater metagenome TaxID=449393 RepID=A0A6J5YPH5_9ZZZZ
MESTFVRKSPKLEYLLLSVLFFMIEATTFSPTFLIAVSPKRISTPLGVYSESDSFTSGAKTLMPLRRHSFRYKALLSLSSRTLVRSAAMYSVG